MLLLPLFVSGGDIVQTLLLRLAAKRGGRDGAIRVLHARLAMCWVWNNIALATAKRMRKEVHSQFQGLPCQAKD